jgi:hypothetical protein
MTPERKAASRLGWLPILGAMWIIVFVCIVPPIWYVSLPIALVCGMILTHYEPALYRWVTAPEREVK